MTLTRKEEYRAEIAGVPGRMYPRIPNADGTRYRSQTWISESRPAKGYDKGAKIRCKLRFDDNCNNGHRSFAITGEVYVPGRRDIEAGGCIHEEIAQYFPELKPLIKWHLCSTDGPMHYVANTCYLASDKDHNGHAAGEPSSWRHAIQFGAFPLTWPHGGQRDAFIQWLETLENYDLEVMAVHHKHREGDTYRFAPKYTFLPYAADTWHRAPFDTEAEALEFLQALQQYPPQFLRIPTSWSEGKERDLDAARRTAIWPEASDSNLTVPREMLEASLLARLPGLIGNFRAAMEACGFDWE